MTLRCLKCRAPQHVQRNMTPCSCRCCRTAREAQRIAVERASQMPRDDKAKDIDDAEHLLNAARAIMGCSDPSAGVVADAECVRQLAINFRGALSRLLESPHSDVRRAEAEGVLAGREYDPADTVAADSSGQRPTHAVLWEPRINKGTRCAVFWSEKSAWEWMRCHQPTVNGTNARVEAIIDWGSPESDA